MVVFTRGGIVLVFIPNAKRFGGSVCYTLSVVHYIVFLLIFHHPCEPSEIHDWLVLLNQNELSYATEPFAAH